MTVREEFSLWAQMLRIRLIEEEIANRYHQKKMRCPTHLSIGQEAVAVAVGAVAHHSDYAVSTHRCHAHYLGKGGDVNSMIAEIYGKAAGCSKGRGGSMHLIDKKVGFMGSTAIVGNTIPIGVGLGLAAKRDAKKQVSYVFLGDSAVEEGVFFESVNFAVLASLPVIFVCENNMYSVYSPLKVRQPEGRKIWAMVGGLGARAWQADGNDVLEAKRTIAEATEICRAGNGPCFIEFSTYRWREHCGPNYDNDIGYRTEKEFQEWKKLDPVVCLADRLRSTHDEFADYETKVTTSISGEIERVFSSAEQCPYPVTGANMLGEYAELG